MSDLTVKQLQQSVDDLLTEKGFKDQMTQMYNIICNQLGEKSANEVLGYYMGALLSTEPAEYIDAVKKNKGLDAQLEEAADTIIRALNIFIMNDVNAEEVIRSKMEKNFGRPYLYGHAE